MTGAWGLLRVPPPLRGGEVETRQQSDGAKGMIMDKSWISH